MSKSVLQKCGLCGRTFSKNNLQKTRSGFICVRCLYEMFKKLKNNYEYEMDLTNRIRRDANERALQWEQRHNQLLHAIAKNEMLRSKLIAVELKEGEQIRSVEEIMSGNNNNINYF